MKSIQRKLVTFIIFGMMCTLSTINANIKPTKGNDEENGHYPATFSFYEDPVGTTGEDISFVDSFSIYSEVDTGSTLASKLIIIDEVDGHKKVLKAEDRDYNYQICMWAHFSPQTYGSVEFWFRTSNINKDTSIHLSQGGVYETSHSILNIFEGKWRYILNVADPVANTWHHILIHFRCVDAINYQGISENKWKVIIDGVDSGELFARGGSLANLDSFMITTNNDMANYDSYYDAIGYSWDPDYNIGDNKESVSTSEAENLKTQEFMETIGMYIVIFASIAVISVALFTAFELHKKKKEKVEPTLT